VHNSYIAPVELSWMLRRSGFVLKTGLGIWPRTAPSKVLPVSATRAFRSGLLPPGGDHLVSEGRLEPVCCPLCGDHTQNPLSHYTSGNIFHADFTATKTFGKWTLGPVAYCYGQVTNDTCAANCLPFTASYRT
jgi:hypothetical protein